jgi:hypothetical protein
LAADDIRFVNMICPQRRVNSTSHDWQVASGCGGRGTASHFAAPGIGRFAHAIAAIATRDAAELNLVGSDLLNVLSNTEKRPKRVLP